MYKVGSTHHTNQNGDIRIISNKGCYDVTVEFVDTGYQTVVSNRQIQIGKIKDKLRPVVYGIGFIGDGPYTSSNPRKAYRTWSSMLERCYSSRCQDKYPHYVGCSVDDRWHNFQTFCCWFIDQYKPGTDLDKDGLVPGNRVYGPDTCQMVCSEINAMMSSGTENTSWIFQHKITGDVVTVFNQRQFAKQIGGHPQSVSRVVTGKAASTMGWKLIETVVAHRAQV